jgi:hypothetical protein
MRNLLLALLGICPVFVGTAGRADIDDDIERAFRVAIVKIDVSSNTIVLKDNVNICKSEGTGFLVSASHVVTAEHVYTLAPECGERIIIVKSKPYNLQKLASIVAAKDDVALLKVDSNFPDPMCALSLMVKDIFDEKAIRFGIPGGLDEPLPAAPVKIGQKTSSFAPLVVLAPTFSEKGESGGPVVYRFNVVGLTRARHEKYPAVSFMTVGETIRSLLAANSVQSGNICNPATWSMWTKFDSVPSIEGLGIPSGGNVYASIKTNGRLTAQDTGVLAGLTDKFKDLSFTEKFVKAGVGGATEYAWVHGDVHASVKTDGGWAAQDPGFIKYKYPTVAGKSMNAGIDWPTDYVWLEGKFGTADEYNKVLSKTARTADTISEQIRKTLWDVYVANGEKSGKWKGIDSNPPLPTPPYLVAPGGEIIRRQ